MKLCVPNAFPISLKNMNDVKRRSTTLDMFPETRSDDHCNVDGGWIHRGHGPVPHSSQYRTNSHKRILVVQEDIDWSSSKIHIGSFLAKGVVKYVSKLSKNKEHGIGLLKKKKPTLDNARILGGTYYIDQPFWLKVRSLCKSFFVFRLRIL